MGFPIAICGGGIDTAGVPACGKAVITPNRSGWEAKVDTLTRGRRRHRFDSGDHQNS